MRKGSPIFITLILLALCFLPTLRGSSLSQKRVAVYSNDIDWDLCGQLIIASSNQTGNPVYRVRTPLAFDEYDIIIILGGHKAYTDKNMPKNVAGEYLDLEEMQTLESERDHKVLKIKRVGKQVFYVFAGSDRYDTKEVLLDDNDGDGKANILEAVGGYDPEHIEGALYGKRILFIISFKDFRDEELSIPSKILEDEDAEIEIASTKKGIAKGMLGMSVVVDKTLEEVNVDEYDAIVFVGGSGTLTYLWGNELAANIAAEAFAKGKVVAAICLAPGVLAEAGILEGKSATSYVTARSKLEAAGAIWVDQPVVQDGNIITAQGPEAAHEFGEIIKEALILHGS